MERGHARIMATTFPGIPASKPGASRAAQFDRPAPAIARWLFAFVLTAAIAYAGGSIAADIAQVGEKLAPGVFLFLALALVIALGFEFVNGFHDTANAVATVIYTNALPAPVAVVWAGAWNFVGVVTSSGAVAYSIVTLLPVELILHVGSAAGFAMIFALLLAAVAWNLATWYVGLPNSSSHALIGSILGVGLANQLMAAHGAASGVDWGQATKVLSALLFSPLIGFAGALSLLWLLRRIALMRAGKTVLDRAPSGDEKPPKGIRALLIATCTAVSFAHGGNDGQKGMGLIMLILIGCAPTAYALNRTGPASATPAFVRAAGAAGQAFAAHGERRRPTLDAARATLTGALQTRKVTPPVFDALGAVTADVSQRIAGYGALAHVPAAATPNLRNDMYLALDAGKLVLAGQATGVTDAEAAAIKTYDAELEHGTRFIPFWVQISVAIALGLGTMVGWRRIVVTVGERIGKTHLTYGMGASAEIVAALTILAAERWGAPVSTTHILSSGVAGASVAQGAGLQWRTIRNMALAWIMTLPAAMLLAGGLYWLLLAGVRALG
jgi:PiT family inorganic phosphate transporter